MIDTTPIAVCSRTFSSQPGLRSRLLESHSNVRFNDDGLALKDSDLIAFLSGIQKAIVALEPINASVLAHCPELRRITKFGVGLDSIVQDDLDSYGVSLGWRGGVNKRAVAEWVIAQSIHLLRGLSVSNGAMQDGDWRPVRGRQLSSVCFGILGCGHIGKEVVRLLQPFGARIIACDIRDYSDFYASFGVQSVSLDELLEASDVLSVHVPLDASTANILHAERLARLRPGTIVLNAARGGLMDERALVERLRTGALAGAALDVYAQEPPDMALFSGVPNLLLTSHLGGSSEEAIWAMGVAAIDGLAGVCG